MKVLLVGSGGREHAIATVLAKSNKLTTLFAFPGNPGILSLATLAECENTIDSITQWAANEQIDLIVCGPETYLVQGLADAAQAYSIPVFGPNKKAAMLEGSKTFSKNFMKKYNIPTADFFVTEEYNEAVEFVKALAKYPVVIKADGLAAGKGVKIAMNENEALRTIDEYMIHKSLGASGSKIVFEEFMTGEEMSIFFITDGNKFLPLIAAKDYKRAYDNDQGDNTGGMGCYAPHQALDEKLKSRINQDILPGIMKGFAEENFDYRGVLFVGLMLTSDGPKVVEFNCRFGDPETQGIMPLLDEDAVELFFQAATGKLEFNEIRWKKLYAASVVIASKGYPADFEKNKAISFQTSYKDYIHAGTKWQEKQLVTNGGRVLNAVATGQSKQEALDNAYMLANQVQFEGAFFRKDIGS